MGEPEVYVSGQRRSHPRRVFMTGQPISAEFPFESRYVEVEGSRIHTASLAGSLLMDLQVGGASKFKVAKDGTASPPYRPLLSHANNAPSFWRTSITADRPEREGGELPRLSTHGSPTQSQTVPPPLDLGTHGVASAGLFLHLRIYKEDTLQHLPASSPIARCEFRTSEDSVRSFTGEPSHVTILS
jgi:hypothetical protein